MPGIYEKIRTDLLFDRGVRQARKGSFARALAYFEEVLERVPDYSLAYANMGYCHFKMGRMAEALAAYESARTLAPEDAEHRYDLGCVHHAQGQRDTALELFREALELQPNHAEAYAAIEQIRIEMGLPAIEPQVVSLDTEEDLGQEPRRDSTATAPLSAAEYLKRGEELFEQSDFEGALEAWGEAAGRDQKNPRIHNNRAAALFELGRHQEAIEACSMALRIKPDYAIAHMTRGEIFAALGNRDAVMREYTALNLLDEDMARQLLDMIDNGEEGS
ncbi:MAG: tetratricopeptide repeat protein [Candidatus Hydrogenedentes bacterium]|nr:tetratricopeptide repeat protein [Candidatus Hydrogenedentota bacterium]